MSFDALITGQIRLNKEKGNIEEVQKILEKKIGIKDIVLYKRKEKDIYRFATIGPINWQPNNCYNELERLYKEMAEYVEKLGVIMWYLGDPDVSYFSD